MQILKNNKQNHKNKNQEQSYLNLKNYSKIIFKKELSIELRILFLFSIFYFMAPSLHYAGARVYMQGDNMFNPILLWFFIQIIALTWGILFLFTELGGRFNALNQNKKKHTLGFIYKEKLSPLLADALMFLYIFVQGVFYFLDLKQIWDRDDFTNIITVFALFLPIMRLLQLRIKYITQRVLLKSVPPSILENSENQEDFIPKATLKNLLSL